MLTNETISKLNEMHLGTMAAGAVTIISNHCHSKKIKG